MEQMKAVCAIILVMGFCTSLLQGARIRCVDNSECPEDHCCLAGKSVSVTKKWGTLYKATNNTTIYRRASYTSINVRLLKVFQRLMTLHVLNYCFLPELIIYKWFLQRMRPKYDIKIIYRIFYIFFISFFILLSFFSVLNLPFNFLSILPLRFIVCSSDGNEH
jgi:hypothetical protein